MYAAIHFTSGLHETEWEFYDERTFNAHFCTSAQDTVVTQYCVKEKFLPRKSGGLSNTHELSRVDFLVKTTRQAEVGSWCLPK